MQVARSPVAHGERGICGGVPVIVGTRLPAASLFDHPEMRDARALSGPASLRFSRPCTCLARNRSKPRSRAFTLCWTRTFHGLSSLNWRDTVRLQCRPRAGLESRTDHCFDGPTSNSTIQGPWTEVRPAAGASRTCTAASLSSGLRRTAWRISLSAPYRDDQSSRAGAESRPHPRTARDGFAKRCAGHWRRSHAAYSERSTRIPRRASLSVRAFAAGTAIRLASRRDRTLGVMISTPAS